MMDTSEKMFEQACRVMPGGVNSPVRAYRAVGMTRRFIRGAKGAYIADVDGVEYIDYVGSWGPMILGHAHPKVLDAVAEVIKEEEDLEIYTSGANNIFKYPELADHEKASELISAFEEKQGLSTLVQETLSDDSNTGIQVYIGEEAPMKNMKDCSVVTATYELDEGVKGTIGIIGPKRMDYDHVVDTLKNLMHQLEELYKK